MRVKSENVDLLKPASDLLLDSSIPISSVYSDEQGEYEKNGLFTKGSVAYLFKRVFNPFHTLSRNIP